LVIVTGVGPLATDSYLAALPELRRSLGTSAAVAQLTLTAFIIGMAAGQILFGPVSDGRGRRRLLLGGAVVFTVTSALCAAAPSGLLLVALRLLQGLAAGSGVAIGRAVVGDAYPPTEAARRYGTLAAITFIGPVLAPAAGGLVLVVGSWRTIFEVLTGFGVLMILAVWWGIPETLIEDDRHEGGLRATVARMADLAGDWSFMRHVALQCLVNAGFFTYIGGSSFVLEQVYGISEGTYSAVFGVNALVMVCTSTLFRFLVGRVAPARLRLIGMSVSASAALGMLGCAVYERIHASPPPLAVVWVLLSVLVGGMGLTIPSATALGQEAGRRFRGTAAALQGGLGFAAGAAVTPLTGLFGYATLLPMALLMSGFFALAMALLAVLMAPREGLAKAA
jgi:DHA1 family bicyclomycin/chloramphenicol resistance-like MFS transporter